ncbi:MAG: cytochrome P450 [Terriglobales bacterium]|jgi:cytochrome P450
MLQRPPGPKPRFLIGNIPLASRDPLAVFRRWAQDYGDIFYYRAGWIHVYFLNHPDLIESVLVRNYQSSMKDRVVQNSRWFLGNGLLTSEGEHWKRQRRLSQPSFHREKIASYATVMTNYADQMLSHWQDGSVIDIHQEMMKLTLRIVLRALFNVESEETEEISEALNVMLRHSTGLRLLLPPFVRQLPLPGMFEVRRAVDGLNTHVYKIIHLRREHGSEAEDLLSTLMEARDEDGSQMNDLQLRDEVMTFLLAGHETTALALSWAWYLLGQNSRAQQELHEEVDRVLAGRAPNLSDLPSLTCAESVIKESMRLYPPAWAVARQAIRDFELGGYQIPVGANLVMSQWVMHRDARFFSDPEQFDPSRWRTEACLKLPKFAYFPFGGGPRQCVGASFAMMEAILLLATIAGRFQVHAVAGDPVEPVPSFTLRPKHGIRVALKERPGRTGSPLAQGDTTVATSALRQ